MHRVSIVIPFYNGDEFIGACLKSLSVGSCAVAEKIVVNNSDKPTEIRSIAAFYGNVTVIDTRPRIGYGRACNRGAKLAIQGGSEFIIILNQDSIAHEDLVSALISPFEESVEVVLTAPILYDDHFTSIESYFVRYYLSMCPALVYDALNHNFKTWYEVGYVNGACFSIRTEFINKYGLFDPIYFMYGEDEDLSRRIRYLNLKMAIVPKARVAHHNQLFTSEETKQDRNGGSKALIWVRHSRSIFELKDLDKALLITYGKICFWNIVDYLRYAKSSRIADLLHALISDIKLLINLPRIARSRKAERRLLRNCLPLRSHHGL